MLTCTHCGKSNRDGLVFCENCGISLVPVPLATRQLDGQSIRSGTDELGADRAVLLQVGTLPPIVVQIHKDLILGRLTEQGVGTTYINLSPMGAQEQGVSRRHARLTRDNQALFLMDLNSTNGTKLNGERIPAATERRIRDGDEITLGKLKLFVYFNF